MRRSGWRTTGPLHGDLVLRLNQFDRRCDSFYLNLNLAHDNSLLPEDRHAEKVRRVLVRLLEEWKLAVVALHRGEVTYLPYEFDDQATGWLQVSAVNSDYLELLLTISIFACLVSPRRLGVQPDLVRRCPRANRQDEPSLEEPLASAN